MCVLSLNELCSHFFLPVNSHYRYLAFNEPCTVITNRYMQVKVPIIFSPLLVSNAAERTEQGAGETGTGERKVVDGGWQAGTRIRGLSLSGNKCPSGHAISPTILTVESQCNILMVNKYLATQLT